MASKIRHPKKRAFLAAFSETGNISQAAKLADVDRSMHYEWLKSDEKYAEAFADAMEQAAEALEMEARRRALHGVDEPVFYKGEEVGAVRKYSDTLLIFLMKGAMPEKYKDRVAQEHSGKMALDVDIERMSDDELLSGIAEAVQAINDLSGRVGKADPGGSD